jgi:hypothetical protein
VSISSQFLLFLLYESLMSESHVSWMTVLHCYIMWFHKSCGTKNTIHIRACFFTWGKARGVLDDNRNLMGSKTLPTIWGTYMKLVTKYQISAINGCWEKCDEKCAYMFNVYKNQLSRQTGNRNLTGPKTLPTIWHTYMKLVTKYQIPVINSCLGKWDEKCAYTWFLYTLNI